MILLSEVGFNVKKFKFILGEIDHLETVTRTGMMLIADVTTDTRKYFKRTFMVTKLKYLFLGYVKFSADMLLALKELEHF